MLEPKAAASKSATSSPMSSGSAIALAGETTDQITARFSNQFLALLSQHLYSSPNKAFEELVTNSWDADATNVYVHIPEALGDQDSAIWILDDGCSMDVSGLQALWTVAHSTKRIETRKSRRQQIGKFGIGKLATYILCNELSYICKEEDGKIRIVTMDYRRIDNSTTKNLEELPLDVRELSEENLHSLLSEYKCGDDISALIKRNVPNLKTEVEWEDEYGGKHEEVEKSNQSWTLAIMSSLKPEGQSIKIGWINYLLRTALPLGSSININVNGQAIGSKKDNIPVLKEWTIGPELNLDSLSLPDGTQSAVKSEILPYPHLVVEHLGEVTGKIAFYERNIDGGKSEDIGPSNGFFINVLGRVINLDSEIFKFDHLNLSVSSRLRVTVRIDELDEIIAANRETIAEGVKLTAAKTLLQAFFNQARREYTKEMNNKFSGASKSVKDSIGEYPVESVGLAIMDAIENDDPLPIFIDTHKLEDEPAVVQSWLTSTQENLGESIKKVQFDNLPPDRPIVKYDMGKRAVSVNRNHPFIVEHTQTEEQISTIRDLAFVDLMTEVYMVRCGLRRELIEDINHYRDRSLRLFARIRRTSASEIVSALSEWTSSAKPFEHIVGDALDYIGFSTRRMGNSGEPEGVATAFIPPIEDEKRASYKLTYDAKSTSKRKAKTSNLNIAGLARHRDDYEADFSLVVAPDYEDGALSKEADANKVTPIRAVDLAKLVVSTVSQGPIDLIRLKELFLLHDPDDVAVWVETYVGEASEHASIDLSTLFSVLDELVGADLIDTLSCDVIAVKCQEKLASGGHPTRKEVANILTGLSALVPSVLSVDETTGRDVYLLASPQKILSELRKQTARLPDEYKIGLLSEAEFSELSKRGPENA